METSIVPFKAGIHLREPISGITSLTSAGLAIAALVMMIIAGVKYGNAWHVVSASVFGVSMILLYTASALYHLLPLSENGVRMLKRLDHMMIFVLIAGTYTPFCLVPLRGAWGWSLFGVAWGLAFLGIILKAYFIHAPRWISTLIYLGMGWMSMIFIYPIITKVPTGAVVWLVIGGLLYTIGAIIYAKKWPDPFPKVFGFHEIWHLFIMTASACHFWAVFKYIRIT